MQHVYAIGVFGDAPHRGGTILCICRISAIFSFYLIAGAPL